MEPQRVVTHDPAPIWPLQDAKARFSELLDRCLSDGPQVVSRRGEAKAVLVPLEAWEDLKRRARPNLKELLLADEPRFDLESPPRGRLTRRPPVDLG
jgi:antitoxin Phd